MRLVRTQDGNYRDQQEDLRRYRPTQHQQCEDANGDSPHVGEEALVVITGHRPHPAELVGG